MKEMVKVSLKNLTNGLSCGKDVDFNEYHEIGFTISKFILIKESMIKKCDIDGKEVVFFDVDENFDCLMPINKLAKYVCLNHSFINFCGDFRLKGVHGKLLKYNIEIIHMVRNSLAHNKYEIEDGFLKINNPGFLICDIPLSMIEEFNNNITNRNKCELLSNNIYDIFCNFDYDNLLYMSLYSYMMMVLSGVDELDIDYSKIKSVYMYPNFVAENHQFGSSEVVLDQKMNSVSNVSLAIDTYYHHPNYNHYFSIENRESKNRLDINKSVDNLYSQQIRSIRNAIEHGNVCVDGNDIILSDMPNQDDCNAICYQIKNGIDNFFNLAKDIDEKNISNDDFCFLNGIFMIVDKSYLEKLNVLEDKLFEIQCKDDLFLFDEEEFTIDALANIIDCLKNTYKQDCEISELFENLNSYLNKSYNLIFNFKSYILQMTEEIDEIVQESLDDTIPTINKYEMLQMFSKYSKLLMLLDEALNIINDLISLQEKSLMLINNYERVIEIDTSRILTKRN